MRRFFENTLDLLVDLLAKVGLVRGDTYWVRQRLRRRLLGENETNARGGAPRRRYTTCRACGALATAEQTTCGQCGAPLPGPVASRVSSVARALTPSVGSVSMTLVSVIVAIYLATVVAAPKQGSFLSPSFEILARLGGMHVGAILLEGQWWRLVNAVFLHGGVLHILFNAYVLSSIGPLIEAVLGRRRFLVLFVFTGVASFCFSFAAAIVTATPKFSVGASGAVFGLLGYGIAQGYRHPSGPLRQAAPQLLFWVVLNFFIGLSVGYIDNAAHFGGLVAGGGFALALDAARRLGPGAGTAWSVAAFAAGVLPLIGFALALLAG